MTVELLSVQAHPLAILEDFDGVADVGDGDCRRIAGRIALIRLREYLDPKIYNQLYLLAQDGHMEYPRLEERVFVDAVKEARVIIVSTDAELEKLNYSNIFDLTAVVERV